MSREINLEMQTTAELGILLGRAYNQLMIAQQNVQNINAMLEKRKAEDGCGETIGDKRGTEGTTEKRESKVKIKRGNNDKKHKRSTANLQPGGCRSPGRITLG